MRLEDSETVTGAVASLVSDSMSRRALASENDRASGRWRGGKHRTGECTGARERGVSTVDEIKGKTVERDRVQVLPEMTSSMRTIIVEASAADSTASCLTATGSRTP